MADDKKVTVRDLQTFIDAVEFASDQEEWTPSPKQWKRIRDMINNLESASVAQPQPQVQYAQPVQPHYQPPLQLAQPAPTFSGPSTLSGVTPSGAPFGGGMPTAAPFGGTPAGAAFGGGAAPVRTPDIDTSNGKPYQSSFAL